MRLKRIAPWLLPTFIAPMLGASLYVLLISRAVELPIKVPTVVWIIAAMVASGVSLVIGFMMALTDVALLKLKLREPPTGWRVWLMGMMAPTPVLFTWQKLLRFAMHGVVPALIAFFVPMLIVALVTRLFLGTRPEAWKK
jgi:hypothetical protein